jgi:hypothetical protein
MAVDMTREEVATTIENFLNGVGGRWNWDDFVSVPITDSRLDAIRERCNGLSAEFPVTEGGHYCGPDGFEVMREFVRVLRKPLEQPDL